MSRHLVMILTCLVGVPLAAGQDAPPGEAELKILQGKWNSPVLPSGSPDSVIIRTLQFGLGKKADAVRLSWSMYCGRNSIAGDFDFTGRLVGIETKGKERRLILADAKGVRADVGFELVKDQMMLKGKIKGIDVGYEWKREAPVKKE